MDPEELITRYPRLYHVADPSNWPSINQQGLLSTSALLDLFEVEDAQRTAIEARRRSESVSLWHPVHGTVHIRDNKPMTDAALQKCLAPPLTPTDWYRALNRKVFFWLTMERVTGLLTARAYRDRPHVVIELDTGAVLRSYGPAIRLSPINSGSTLYDPQPRGHDTFTTIADYPFELWRKRRGPRRAIAELTIEGGLPDLSRYCVDVRHVPHDGTCATPREQYRYE